MLRQALGVLLGGATAARPLGGRSGVRPGTSGLVSATSTTWTVNPHAGALDLESNLAAGPYYYSVDDTTNTGTVTAADATNPRIDLVYVTLNDPAEGDGSSTPGAVFGYLAGTPAATPSVPATPARSMALSNISVPKSGTGSPTTSDVAPFITAAGAPTRVRSLAERNALSAYEGLRVVRLDLGSAVELYTGGGWTLGHKSAGFAATTPTFDGTVLFRDVTIDITAAGFTASPAVATGLSGGPSFASTAPATSAWVTSVSATSVTVRVKTGSALSNGSTVGVYIVCSGY